MLSAKNITYHIDGKRLLDDVSIDFEAGKLNLIIGPNGAGKSTLIKILSAQLKPQSGKVYYGNKASDDLSILELARIRSVLSQNIDLAFPLTVKEIVMMGRHPHFSGMPTAKDEAACEEAMRFFDVSFMKDRNYMTLSGGEKQRVHFARVLAQIWYPVAGNLRYLILDEPLTFLDVYYQFDFMKKITQLIKEQEIVVIGVVHDLNLAAKFADKIVLLNSGKVLAAGDKRKVLTPAHIETAYHLKPVIHEEGENIFLFFN